MEVNTAKKHWYDSTALVIILTIIIFPVGLYGLYKNTTLQPKAKWGIFAVWVILVIIVGNIPGQKKAENVNTSPKNSKQFVPDTSAIDNMTREEKELIKKYHIEIDRFIAPKVNPLRVREHVVEYIKNDFDHNFLSSVDLSIFDATGMNYTFAQFKKDYIYTDQRTGKNKKGKRVYRSFKVLNDGTVQEEGGSRTVYKELNSLERDKANAYSLELRETMYNENRFNKQQWERLSNLDYENRLERQKQEYDIMVQKYDKNNQ